MDMSCMGESTYKQIFFFPVSTTVLRDLWIVESQEVELQMWRANYQGIFWFSIVRELTSLKPQHFSPGSSMLGFTHLLSCLWNRLPHHARNCLCLSHQYSTNGQIKCTLQHSPYCDLRFLVDWNTLPLFSKICLLTLHPLVDVYTVGSPFNHLRNFGGPESFVFFLPATSLCTLWLLTISHELKWPVHIGDSFTYTTNLDFSPELYIPLGIGHNGLIGWMLWPQAQYNQNWSYCILTLLPHLQVTSHHMPFTEVKSKEVIPDASVSMIAFSSSLIIPHADKSCLTNDHTLSQSRPLSLLPGPRRCYTLCLQSYSHLYCPHCGISNPGIRSCLTPA